MSGLNNFIFKIYPKELQEEMLRICERVRKKHEKKEDQEKIKQEKFKKWKE